MEEGVVAYTANGTKLWNKTAEEYLGKKGMRKHLSVGPQIAVFYIKKGAKHSQTGKAKHSTAQHRGQSKDQYSTQHWGQSTAHPNWQSKTQQSTGGEAQHGTQHRGAKHSKSQCSTAQLAKQSTAQSNWQSTAQHGGK